jgi:hypothetical protein
MKNDMDESGFFSSISKQNFLRYQQEHIPVPDKIRGFLLSRFTWVIRLDISDKKEESSDRINPTQSDLIEWDCNTEAWSIGDGYCSSSVWESIRIMIVSLGILVYFLFLLSWNGKCRLISGLVIFGFFEYYYLIQSQCSNQIALWKFEADLWVVSDLGF